MCGRFQPRSIIDYIEVFDQWYDLDAITSIERTQQYNFPPDSTTHTMFLHDGLPAVTEMHWRFYPPHLKDSLAITNFRNKFQTINARSESLISSRLYGPHKLNRCLIPLFGWFEWSGKKGNKTPYFIRPKSDRLIALAGIYVTNSFFKHPTFTILTTPASPGFNIHHRQPLVLEMDQFGDFLGMSPSMKPITEFASPYPSNKLQWWPVTKEVGNPRFNSPDAIKPVPPHDDQDINSGDWF